MTCFVSKPSRITLVELSIINTSYQKLPFGYTQRHVNVTGCTCNFLMLLRLEELLRPTTPNTGEQNPMVCCRYYNEQIHAVLLTHERVSDECWRFLVRKIFLALEEVCYARGVDNK